MTTYGMSRWPATLAPPLTWQGMRDAMRASTGVMITLIVACCVVVLATVGAVVVLVVNGKDTAALLTLVNTVMLAFGLKASLETKAKATHIEQQTNGTQARLMDAALRRGEDGSPS